MFPIATCHLPLATIFLHFVDYLALFYLVPLLWVPFFGFGSHPAIRFWRRLGHRAFALALPIWLLFAVGIFIARHEIFARRLERSVLTWAVGGVLLLVSSWLEVQSRHVCGWRRLVGLTELDPERRMCGVTRTGVYARVRHPPCLLYMLTMLSMAFLPRAQFFAGIFDHPVVSNSRTT